MKIFESVVVLIAYFGLYMNYAKAEERPLEVTVASGFLFLGLLLWSCFCLFRSNKANK